MANPRLNDEQRENSYKPFLKKVVDDLHRVFADDPRALWAARRKLAKDLTYMERGTPYERRQLQQQKMTDQKGLCAICGKELPERGAELDRQEAYKGYTPENTRLVHHECHVRDQAEKNYS